MAVIHRKIEVVESDGYKRGGIAYPLRMTFDSGELIGSRHARVFHPHGRELPIQIDIEETWPDGSTRSCDVYFPLHIPANGGGQYTFETGPDVSPSARQVNPVRIDADPLGLTINQGPVTYIVKSDPYGAVVSAVFDRDVWKGAHPTGADITGPKSFLIPGSSAPVLVTEDGTRLVLKDAVKLGIETSGPRAGRIRITGDYPDGISFTSHITFYSGVSWYRHAFSLTGNFADIASVVFEDTFDLAEGPLLSAFGSRVNSFGQPTSWAVVTDGVSTIDIATQNARGNSGSVRYESEADGRFRVIAPYSGNPIVTFYHFLITPPADHYHTPAAAMVAPPHIHIYPSEDIPRWTQNA